MNSTIEIPETPRVLVPLAILDGESLAPAVVDALAGVHVELVGYHVLPEQTAPGQARMQFEDRMQRELDDLVTEFEEAGGSVETRLVFTHDPEHTFERVAVEAACDAILLNNPAPAMEDVLVPLRGEVNVERVVALVAEILDATDATATLYHVTDSEENRAEGQKLVDAARESLTDRDVAPDRLRTEVVVSETPRKTLVAEAGEADLVIMGESKPSVREMFFGEVSEQVSGQSLSPVLVIRRLPPVESAGADSEQEEESE